MRIVGEWDDGGRTGRSGLFEGLEEDRTSCRKNECRMVGVCRGGFCAICTRCCGVELEREIIIVSHRSRRRREEEEVQSLWVFVDVCRVLGKDILRKGGLLKVEWQRAVFGGCSS